MGRPERTVNADSGPVARFACDLRALRKAAGSPSYRHLAAKANYSATVLSRAASGRELPSLPVVLAYVGACSGDAGEWQARWLELAGQLDPPADPVAGEARADGEAGDSSGEEGDADGRPRGTGRLIPAIRSHGLVAGLSLLAAVSTAAAVILAWHGQVTAGGQHTPRATPPPSSRPAVPADTPLSDGHDPTPSGCAPDATTVASAFTLLNKPVTVSGQHYQAGMVVGMVQLRYSAHCHAAWARAEPLPAFSVPSLGWVDVRILRPADGTFESFNIAEMTTLYGDLLLTSHGCVTASASFRFRAGAAAYAATRCWQPR